MPIFKAHVMIIVQREKVSLIQRLKAAWLKWRLSRLDAPTNFKPIAPRRDDGEHNQIGKDGDLVP